MVPLIDKKNWVPVGIEELETSAWEVVRSRENATVVAGPGAGKTELLAQRACYLLQTGMAPDPRRILAISFKRDAAKNLKERVSQRCNSEDSLRFDSYTFDAFSKGLLDRFYPALSETWRPTSDYEILLPRNRGRIFSDFWIPSVRPLQRSQVRGNSKRSQGYLSKRMRYWAVLCRRKDWMP